MLTTKRKPGWLPAGSHAAAAHVQYLTSMPLLAPSLQLRLPKHLPSCRSPPPCAGSLDACAQLQSPAVLTAHTLSARHPCGHVLRGPSGPIHSHVTHAVTLRFRLYSSHSNLCAHSVGIPAGNRRPAVRSELKPHLFCFMDTLLCLLQPHCLFTSSSASSAVCRILDPRAALLYPPPPLPSAVPRRTLTYIFTTRVAPRFCLLLKCSTSDIGLVLVMGGWGRGWQGAGGGGGVKLPRRKRIVRRQAGACLHRPPATSSGSPSAFIVITHHVPASSLQLLRLKTSL